MTSVCGKRNSSQAKRIITRLNLNYSEPLGGSVEILLLGFKSWKHDFVEERIANHLATLTPNTQVQLDLARRQNQLNGVRTNPHTCGVALPSQAQLDREGGSGNSRCRSHEATLGEPEALLRCPPKRHRGKNHLSRLLSGRSRRATLVSLRSSPSASSTRLATRPFYPKFNILTIVYVYELF